MEEIGEFIGDLFTDDSNTFEPIAFYNPEMDYLMYINEDCSYRADRISRALTVLWHPYEEKKLIGFKLKGFRLMFNRVKDTSAISEDQFPDIMQWLTLAIYRSAEEIIAEHEKQRLREISALARQLAGNYRIKPETFTRVLEAA